MGRRNKTYSKDLHQQAYDQLTGMLAFGESKKEAMATGTAKNKIFSHATYKNYWKHIKYFLGYIKEKHPECTTLKNAKKYVNEWLQSRVDQGLSAWTVQLEAKALGKLYGISPDDEAYFDPPKRNRQDIKRSRGDRPAAKRIAGAAGKGSGFQGANRSRACRAGEDPRGAASAERRAAS